MNVSSTLIGLLGAALVLTGLMLSYFKRRAHKAEIELQDEKDARETDGLRQALDQLKKDAEDAEERYRDAHDRYKPNGEGN